MTKIYKDAKDVPVAAKVIYTTGFFNNPVAYHDIEMEHAMSSEELKDAFVKGCVVVNTQDVIDFYAPVMFEGALENEHAATINIVLLDDGNVTMVTISAVDE